MVQRISTPSRTREIIEKYNFNFKKGFGQNFLIDSNVLDNIVEAAGVSKEDCVLEIGPGIGSLTQVLAENAEKVVAIEIDKNLLPILAETLGEYGNVEIINSDVLKLDLNRLIDEKNGGRAAKIVANLPYYITTPILMELLEKKANIDTITVMVQKEVAERMQAEPGRGDYGALSIAVGYYCDAKMDFIVQPSCFMPRPKVASAVITLHVRKEPRVLVQDEALFFHIVKCAFGQRRKTLLNSIFNQAGLGLSKEDLAEILKSLSLDERIRGEALSIELFGSLSDRIHEKIAK